MAHKETHQNEPRRQQPPSGPQPQRSGKARGKTKTQPPEREGRGTRVPGVGPEEEADYDPIEEELLADEAESVDEEDAELAGVGASSLGRSGSGRDEGQRGQGLEEEEDLAGEEGDGPAQRDQPRKRRH